MSFTVMTVALAALTLMVAFGAVDVRAQATAPGAPRNVKIEDTIYVAHADLNGVLSGLNVSWDAPASDGGSPITGYKIRYEYERIGRQEVEEVAVSSDLSVLPHNVASLRSNWDYKVSVIATNAVGDSPPSAQVGVTTVAPGDQLLAFIEENVVKVHGVRHPWLRKTLTHMKKPDFDLDVHAEPNWPTGSVGLRCSGKSGTALARCRASSMDIRVDHFTSVPVIVHEMAHVYTLTNGLQSSPGPLGAAHVYFENLNLGPYCEGTELFADVLTMTVLPGETTHYWSSCNGGNAARTREARAVVRSALRGRMPAWFKTTYGSGKPDLERFWSHVKALPHCCGGGGRSAIYQLRNAFGGYCSIRTTNESAYDDGAVRNPWKDGGCVPEAPGNVAASATAAGALAVSWSAPGDDGGAPVEGYKVQWKSGSQDYDASRQALIADPDEALHVIESLSVGTEYSVRVVAYNANGDGAGTGEVSATVSAVDGVAPALAGAKVEGSTLTLTWSEALDTTSVPATSAFTVNVNGARRGITGIGVAGEVVTLTLAAPATTVDTLTVGYTPPSDASAKAIRDVARNKAAAFSGRAVANRTVIEIVSIAITSAPGADGTYTYGKGGGSTRETIEATVTFSESVNVTGAPRLETGIRRGVDVPRLPKTGSSGGRLVFGPTKRALTYSGGSGTPSLTFRHTVEDGDRAAAGVSIRANRFHLDGGAAIRGASGRDALLAHAGLAPQSGHRVDAVLPRPAGVRLDRSHRHVTAGTGSAVVKGNKVTLVYNKALDGTKVPAPGYGFKVYAGGARHQVYQPGVVGGTELSVSGIAVSGNKVVLTLKDAVAPDAEVRVDYTVPYYRRSAALTDAAGNQAPNFFSDVIDNLTVAPGAAKVTGLILASSPGADGAYAIDDAIDVRVQYSASVTVDTTNGTPALNLRVGSRTRKAVYSAGSGTRELTFRYTVVAYDVDADGVSIESGALLLDGGTIGTVGSGVPATRTHAGLDAQPGHLVDGERPQLLSASVDGAALTLTFTEALDEDSVPRARDFQVTVDGSARTVDAFAVSGSTVTLTLASAVAVSEKVTVSVYMTRLKDVAGNTGWPGTVEARHASAALPSVSIAASRSRVTEGAWASFTVTSSPAPLAPLTVALTVGQSGDHAAADEVGSREVIVPTTGSVTLDVATVGDGVDEPDGSVTATLGSGSGYTVSATAGAATVAVADDDDPVPVISIAAKAASVIEGAGAVFTLTASPAPASPLTVDVTVTESGDFATAGATQVTIPTGGTAELGIATVGDGVDEPDGSVTATLASGSGYTVAASPGNAATVAVSDDDDGFMPDAALVAEVAALAKGQEDSNPGAHERLMKVLKGMKGETGGFTAAECRAESKKHGAGVERRWKPWCDEIARREAHEAQARQTPPQRLQRVPEISIAAGSGVTEGAAATFTLTATPAPPSSLTVEVTVTETGGYAAAGTHQVTVPTSGTAKLSIPTTGDSTDEPDGSVTATLGSGSGYTVAASPGDAATVAVADDDDPLPSVSIAAKAASVTEGTGAVFTLTATPAPASSLTVDVTVTESGGYAAAGTHSVTIPTGGTAELSIATTGDDVDEPDGSVTATLATGSGYTVSSTAGAATVAVSDDDDAPAAFVPDAALVAEVAALAAGHEGSNPGAHERLTKVLKGMKGETGGFTAAECRAESQKYGAGVEKRWKPWCDEIARREAHGTKPVQQTPPTVPEIAIAGGSGVTEGSDAAFTLTATPAPASPLTVEVTVTEAGGFATAGTHQVTIPTTGTASLTIATTGDDVDEPDGSVTATLATGSGYTVSATAGAATVAIADDDDPLPSVSIAAKAASVTEGTGAVFTLTATPAPASSLTVDVTVTESGGYAAAGTHSVTIPTGGTAELSIATTGDDVDEPDGSVTATLATGSGYTVSSTAGAATVAVSDDDDAPAAFVPDAALVAEVAALAAGHEGSNPGAHERLTKVLKGMKGETGGFTAAECRAESQKYGAGVEKRWKPWCDEIARREAHEAQARQTPPQRLQQVPEISIAAGSGVTEGTAATFTLTATPAPASSLTVDVTVTESGGYAAAGAHQVTLPTSGTASLSIPTTGDDTDEPDGSVTATLASGSGYTVAASPGDAATVAVADDDDPLPSVSIAAKAASVTEGGSAVFTLTANPAPSASLTVDVTVTESGGYAAAGTHSVTIPTGGTAELGIATTGDDVDDADGSVTATLAAGSGYTVAASPGDAATVAVADDDDPLPSVSIAAKAASVTEGGKTSFTLSASPAPASDLAVRVKVSEASGSDFVAAGDEGARSVIVAAGATEAVFEVATVDNGVDEADGSVTATLVADSGYTVAASPGDAASVSVADDDDAGTCVAPSPPAALVSEVKGHIDDFTARNHANGIRDWTAVLDRLEGRGGMSDEKIAAWLQNAETHGWADGETTLPKVQKALAAAKAAVEKCNNAGKDATPEISITGGSGVTEGGDASFTLTADPAPASDLAVTVTVSEASGSDFVASGDEGAKTVTIPAGQTQASFTVATVDDGADEPDASVTATLAAGTGYSVAASPGDAASVTVADNDGAASALSLTVDDATAREYEGWVRFTVRMSRASPKIAYVRFSTRDSDPVSARAGVDYTRRTENYVVFRPGKTEATISVPIIDDNHDEGSETFEVVLSKPVGATIADGVAVGTIVNTDPMPAAWLARFGRTVAEQALDGIADRMAAPRAPGFDGNLGGIAFNPWQAGRMSAGAASPADPATEREAARAMADIARSFDDGGAGFGAAGTGWGHDTAPAGRPQTMTARELLLGSSFTLTGERGSSGGSLAFWGRAAVGGFDGEEGELSLDGEVTTGMLGADYARDDWLLGLALTQSTGEGGYHDTGPTEGDAGSMDGKVKSSLTAAIPYAALQASDRLKLWGAAGVGSGEVTLTPDPGSESGAGGDPMKADTGWTMAALGLRGDLLAPPADGNGGPAFAIVSDALWANTTSEKATGMAASDSDVTRLRLGLEGSWQMALDGGGSLTPKLELGARHDGGDAETGFGVEIGGGIAWIAPDIGLSLDIAGRTLVAHEADGLKDRGVSAQLTFDPDPASERGLSFSLRQEMGGPAQGGLDALFADDPLSERSGSEATSRWTAEAAWGFPDFGGRFPGIPYVGLGLAAGARDYSIGWRLTPPANAPDLSFGVKATRRESDTAEAEHTAGLEFRVQW